VIRVRPVRIAKGGEISNRCFPIEDEVSNYIQFVELTKSHDIELHKLLTLICCSGVRITEALNSFILHDITKNRYYLRCIALKRKKITKFEFSKERAMHEKELMKLLITKPQAFKTMPLLNLFKLDVSDILENVNDVDEPIRKWKPFTIDFKKRRYDEFFRSLKNAYTTLNMRFRVYYLESKLSGIVKTVEIVPSFHFYRKLFVSELYKRTRDITASVEYMKWSKLERLLDYSKAYEIEKLEEKFDISNLA